MKWKRFWERVVNWEQWPFGLRYLAISPVWLWYSLRSGSFWFFTPSNPTITFGGFEGEGKKEMYELLPEGSFPKTIFVLPAESFEAVRKKLADAQFTYPFCAKPDVGMKGLLFRKINSEADLRYYHENMPIEYIIQDFITYPIEVSVFYYRYPDQQKGVITGFIQKELMEVWGDGRKSLIELIREHPKARYREEEMRIKHRAHLEEVFPDKQQFYLTHAANLNRGARFVNLFHLVDDRLLALFDSLSHRAQFYYGRYDLKCKSIDDLKNGNHFSILEFNGSGAEPNHVYNDGLTLLQAQKVFLRHWKVLYEISRYNHKRGIRYWPFQEGWAFLKKAKQHLKVLEEYDRKVLL